ncbi:MAG: MT-A70 family methyltransferase [Planctomycetaceae bacterium]|nr:MT-A70 family methyltransferase [Planctomycetaceae bacterium]
MQVKISKIIVQDGRREIDFVKVAELASSIKIIGLINPITVDKQSVLIAGLHRLEACKHLGFGEIECVVLDCDELRTELAEIDENLIRNELDPISVGELAIRRDEILDALGLRAKSGTNVKNMRTGAESAPVRTTQDIASEVGMSKRTLQENKQLARDLAPEAKEAVRKAGASKTDALKLARKDREEQEVIAKKLLDGKAATVTEAIREVERDKVIDNLESIATQKGKAAKGLYDVIVIDPPWPMQKIERDAHPEQVGFDYPTMSEEELAEYPIPAANDCHLWLWTTQKFLPMSLRLLDAWGFKYVCEFVWHKNGGFQPFGLPQYNCEFAIYARKGSPKFTDTKAFFTCFEAKRGKHSEKPEEFYKVIRRVTAGRRIDIFNRRKIEGFDGCGNEAK